MILYNEKFWLLLSLVLNLLFLSVLFGSSRSPTNVISLVTTKTKALDKSIEKVVIHGRLKLNRANKDGESGREINREIILKDIDKAITPKATLKGLIKHSKNIPATPLKHSKIDDRKTTTKNNKRPQANPLAFDSSTVKNITILTNMSSFQVNYLSTRPSAAPCDDNVYLTMVINSHPYNSKRRQYIRRTWGNTTEISMTSKTKHRIRVVFIIGKSGQTSLDQSVEKESRVFGDLVLADFKDSIQNLTDKTLLGMLWQRKFCPKAKFFYKGDDDVFVNTYRLIQYADSLDSQHKKKYLVGRVHTSNRIPCRVKKHKYYVSYKDYPRRRFPPYCSGFAYMMTNDCVDLLAKQVKKVKLLKSIDDVYVGLLAEAAGIHPHANNRRFHFYHPAIPKNHIFRIPEINLRIAEHGIISYEKHRKLLDMARKGLDIYT